MIVTNNNIGRYGRAGNQLFQLAAAIGYAEKHGVDAVFPEWYCNYTHKNMSQFFDNPINQSLGSERLVDYKEPNFHFNEIPYHPNVNLNLQGYYQSENYFSHCKALIKHYFTPKEKIEKIDACSIHVRRGDYVGSIHDVCDKYYYMRAIKAMKAYQYVVFSDDIPYCRSIFPEDFVFIDNKLHADSNNIHRANDTDVHDLFLMAACTHHIISNSSYSWWGAWLGEHEDSKIIAPKRWFNTKDLNDKDIIPERWIKM